MKKLLEEFANKKTPSIIIDIMHFHRVMRQKTFVVLFTHIAKKLCNAFRPVYAH